IMYSLGADELWYPFAPDAVMVREKDTESKIASHLGRHPDISVYLEFLRMNARVAKLEDDHLQFLRGYIAHIHADMKWSEYKKFISNGDYSLRGQLWQEENQMDFYLYRNMDWVNKACSDVT